MTGFERQTTGIGSDRSTNWATTNWLLKSSFTCVQLMQYSLLWIDYLRPKSITLIKYSLCHHVSVTHKLWYGQLVARQLFMQQMYSLLTLNSPGLIVGILYFLTAANVKADLGNNYPLVLIDQSIYDLKTHRWCAWGSNPRPQDGRRRRNHGITAAALQ